MLPGPSQHAYDASGGGRPQHVADSPRPRPSPLLGRNSCRRPAHPPSLAPGIDEPHWRKQLLVFAEHFRVITPGVGGHGRSNNPKDELSLPFVAHDIAGFARHLGLKLFHLRGFSFGLYAAFVYAMGSPRSLRFLLLCGMTYRRDENSCGRSRLTRL